MWHLWSLGIPFQRVRSKYQEMANISVPCNTVRCWGSSRFFTTARGQRQLRLQLIAISGPSTDNASKPSWWGLVSRGRRNIRTSWRGKSYMPTPLILNYHIIWTWSRSRCLLRCQRQRSFLAKLRNFLLIVSNLINWFLILSISYVYGTIFLLLRKKKWNSTFLHKGVYIIYC